MLMRIDYSKPSADISKESSIRIKNEKKLFEEQKATSELLLKCENRKLCIVCNNSLEGEKFDHREIPFISCKICGHIQSVAMPPKGYPMSEENGLNFKKIYPKLNIAEYEDRKKRIYKPKLDWALSCLIELGYNIEKLKGMKWTEMGCGAGYFLSALLDAGIKNIQGFDADFTLVKNGNELLNKDIINFTTDEPEKGIAQFPADIYVSFFVLEHLTSSFHFFKELARQKSGTIFIFSVPVFGFITVLENIFRNNYARNLDSVIHTQTFTEDSIKYALDKANFSIVSEWIFGQDIQDFTRFVFSNIQERYPEKMRSGIEQKIMPLQDLLQRSVDKAGFSDQKHIIAIKK